MLVKHESKHCHAPKLCPKYLAVMYIRSCLSLKWPTQRSLWSLYPEVWFWTLRPNAKISGWVGVCSTHACIYSPKVAAMPTLFKPAMAEARPILEDNLTKADTYTNPPFVESAYTPHQDWPRVCSFFCLCRLCYCTAESTRATGEVAGKTREWP